METSIYYQILMHCHFKKRRLLLDIEQVWRAGGSRDDLESELEGLTGSTRCFSLGCIGYDSGRTRLVELPRGFLSAHRVLIDAPAGYLMGYPASGDGNRTPVDREQIRLRDGGPQEPPGAGGRCLMLDHAKDG